MCMMVMVVLSRLRGVMGVIGDICLVRCRLVVFILLVLVSLVLRKIFLVLFGMFICIL